MNVVSYAQIVFKSLFFRLDQPMHMRNHNVIILRMCIDWSSQVSMGSLIYWVGLFLHIARCSSSHV